VPNAHDQSELILYQTDDGITRVHVRLVDGSVWLTQRQLADLPYVQCPSSAYRMRRCTACPASPTASRPRPISALLVSAINAPYRR
jgi:hypothetical protein